MRLQCRAQAGAALPAHKDYLGSLMGLELRREALGDIVLPENQPGTAYVFALEPAAQLICRELFQAGHTELTTELLTLDEVPQFPQAEREDVYKRQLVRFAMAALLEYLHDTQIKGVERLKTVITYNARRWGSAQRASVLHCFMMW